MAAKAIIGASVGSIGHLLGWALACAITGTLIPISAAIAAICALIGAAIVLSVSA